MIKGNNGSFEETQTTIRGQKGVWKDCQRRKCLKLSYLVLAEVTYKYDLGCVFVFCGGKMTAKVTKEDS